MNLVDKFIAQPVYVQLSIFWVLIVTIILAIIEPWLILVFFLSWGTVIAIVNLILFFVTKGELS